MGRRRQFNKAEDQRIESELVKIDFETIEQRVKAQMMEPHQQQEARLFTARQQGKSPMLAAMYGTGMKNYTNYAEAIRNMITREHPLQYNSQFRFVERVKAWGNIPLYNVATKVTSVIICKGEKVPHTDVHYGNLIEATGHGAPEVVGLVWTRRLPRAQIELAAATMLMLGKEIVVLRAFEP